MTNEELAERIHNGDNSLIPQLWQQMERLVRWQANRVLHALGGTGGVEFDDLYNSGYLAFVDAVKSYAPEKGAFSSWLVMYMRGAFAAATNYRSVKQRNDPLHSARSLSEPLGRGTDGVTLGDTIMDDTDRIEAVEDRVWIEQLHDAIEIVLHQLEPKRAEVLRQRYLNGRNLTEISRTTGLSVERCRQLSSDAILKIRRKYAASLRPFVDERTNFYLRVGSRQFTRTSSSAVELLTFRRDALERQYMRRFPVNTVGQAR